MHNNIRPFNQNSLANTQTGDTDPNLYRMLNRVNQTYKYPFHKHLTTYPEFFSPAFRRQIDYASCVMVEGALYEFNPLDLDGNEIGQLLKIAMEYKERCKQGRFTWEVRDFSKLEKEIEDRFVKLYFANTNKFNIALRYLQTIDNQSIRTFIQSIHTQLGVRNTFQMTGPSPVALVNTASTSTASTSRPPNAEHPRSISLDSYTTDFVRSLQFATKINVVSQDTSEAVREMHRSSPESTICVLSMSDGSTIGRGLQEKNLCENSNLKESLASFTNGGTFYKDEYCMITNHSVSHIYAPNVTLRGNCDVKIDVISAAPDHSKKHNEKIVRGILRTAAETEHKNLVLGAIGCGGAGCQPQEIAGYFKKYLSREFLGQFENIIFAIYDPATAEIFKETLRSVPTLVPLSIQPEITRAPAVASTSGTPAPAVASTSGTPATANQAQIDKAMKGVKHYRDIIQNSSSHRGFMTHCLISYNLCLGDYRTQTLRSVNSSKVIDVSNRIPQSPLRNRYNTEVKVLDQDTFAAARALKADSSQRVCVLNLANATYIGGDPTGGSPAQEEFLISHSTLFPALKQFESSGNSYDQNSQLIDGNKFRQIYTDEVTIFGSHHYDSISQPSFPDATTSVITAAALVYGYDSQHWDKMKVIIENILQTAYEEGHTHLVLGALGCGSFGNPPEKVSVIFKELLEGKFKGVFEKVHFAIKGRNSNNSVFSNTLSSLMAAPAPAIINRPNSPQSEIRVLRRDIIPVTAASAPIPKAVLEVIAAGPQTPTVASSDPQVDTLKAKLLSLDPNEWDEVEQKFDALYNFLIDSEIAGPNPAIIQQKMNAFKQLFADPHADGLIDFTIELKAIAKAAAKPRIIAKQIAFITEFRPLHGLGNLQNLSESALTALYHDCKAEKKDLDSCNNALQEYFNLSGLNAQGAECPIKVVSAGEKGRYKITMPINPTQSVCYTFTVLLSQNMGFGDPFEIFRNSLTHHYTDITSSNLIALTADLEKRVEQVHDLRAVLRPMLVGTKLASESDDEYKERIESSYLVIPAIKTVGQINLENTALLSNSDLSPNHPEYEESFRWQAGATPFTGIEIKDQNNDVKVWLPDAMGLDLNQLGNKAEYFEAFFNKLYADYQIKAENGTIKMVTPEKKTFYSKEQLSELLKPLKVLLPFFRNMEFNPERDVCSVESMLGHIRTQMIMNFYQLTDNPEVLLTLEEELPEVDATTSIKSFVESYQKAYKKAITLVYAPKFKTRAEMVIGAQQWATIAGSVETAKDPKNLQPFLDALRNSQAFQDYASVSPTITASLDSIKAYVDQRDENLRRMRVNSNDPYFGDAPFKIFSEHLKSFTYAILNKEILQISDESIRKGLQKLDLENDWIQCANGNAGRMVTIYSMLSTGNALECVYKSAVTKVIDEAFNSVFASNRESSMLAPIKLHLNDWLEGKKFEPRKAFRLPDDDPRRLPRAYCDEIEPKFKKMMKYFLKNFHSGALFEIVKKTVMKEIRSTLKLVTNGLESEDTLYQVLERFGVTKDEAITKYRLDQGSMGWLISQIEADLDTLIPKYLEEQQYVIKKQSDEDVIYRNEATNPYIKSLNAIYNFDYTLEDNSLVEEQTEGSENNDDILEY